MKRWRRGEVADLVLIFARHVRSGNWERATLYADQLAGRGVDIRVDPDEIEADPSQGSGV
jgi:hypothetical protein